MYTSILVLLWWNIYSGSWKHFLLSPFTSSFLVSYFSSISGEAHWSCCFLYIHRLTDVGTNITLNCVGLSSEEMGKDDRKGFILWAFLLGKKKKSLDFLLIPWSDKFAHTYCMNTASASFLDCTFLLQHFIHHLSVIFFWSLIMVVTVKIVNILPLQVDNNL